MAPTVVIPKLRSYNQGLKCNFQGGGTVQLSGPPSSFPCPPFISWAHVSIAGSQIINDRLNILSMIFILFFCCNFVKFGKKTFNNVNLLS